MRCYDIDATPIENLSRRIGEVPAEILDLDPETAALFAREYKSLLLEIEELFLAAFFCFLQIMVAIAAVQLRLERRAASRTRLIWRFLGVRRVNPRPYLEGFLPIYQSAAHNAERGLRAVLADAFTEQPMLMAAFVAQAIASETASEMRTFVYSVPTATTVAEAEEHGDTGKEITDSIKEFLTKFLSDLGFWRMKLKKENVERGLHVLNEVLGMVFRGGGTR